MRSFILCLCLFITATVSADGLIIEPDQGRKPLLTLMRQTKHSLHLVMYGLTDRDLLDAMIRQKRLGRDVKVILEKSPFQFTHQNQHAINTLNKENIDWRGDIHTLRWIHQKTLLIDQQTALVMTFNFTRSTFKNSRNFALVLDDPAKVRAIEAMFAADWNQKTYVSTLPDLLYSPNDSRAKLTALINHASQSIDIYAQSFSDYAIVGALAKAAKRGVQIRLLTSASLRSKPARYLQQAGARLTHSQPLYIHAKVLIFDRTDAVVGSINLTRTSLDDNRELSVITHDRSVVKQLQATFEHDWQQAKHHDAA